MLDPARLVFIDETAVSTNLVRLRGRAPRGVRLIGFAPLGRWETATTQGRMESFRQALRQLNYVKGQNLAIELRYPQKALEELPGFAAELVRLQVDVITTFGDHAPRVVQAATQMIPIVAPAVTTMSSSS